MKNNVGEDLARKVENFVNVMANGEESDKFVEALTRMHPTLQQNFTRLMMKFFSKMAQKHGDLRNQDSIELAKKIVELDIGLSSI